MNAPKYEAAIYRAGSRPQWGVFDPVTRTWIFSAKRGRRSAEALAARLNNPNSNPPEPASR